MVLPTPVGAVASLSSFSAEVLRTASQIGEVPGKNGRQVWSLRRRHLVPSRGSHRRIKANAAYHALDLVIGLSIRGQVRSDFDPVAILYIGTVQALEMKPEATKPL